MLASLNIVGSWECVKLGFVFLKLEYVEPPLANHPGCLDQRSQTRVFLTDCRQAC